MGDALRTLTSHAHQASGHTKGKAKAKPCSEMGSSSLRTPSSVDASGSRKRSRDVGNDISSKISDISDAVLQEIRSTSESNTETKRLKIQARVVSKEMQSRDGHAQREHEMRLKMVENDHE